MTLLLVNLLILILYFKIYKFAHVIDDICQRSDYLKTLTHEIDDINFYDKKKPLKVTIGSILTHMGVCSWVHVIFGWKTALLCAVSPLFVHVVAWKIGYLIYNSSTFLWLAAHYLATHWGWFGFTLGLPMFYAAIECCLNPIGYPFYLILIKPQPIYLLYFVPLIIFLTGKRFRAGIKKRMDFHKTQGCEKTIVFTPKRIPATINAQAYYIINCVVPWRLGFFPDWGLWFHCSIPNRVFWLNCLLHAVFIWWGCTINPWWVLGFYVLLQPYNQSFYILSMFVTERYATIINIFFYALLAKYLEPYPIIFTIVATLYFAKSWLYIDIWKNNEALFRDGVINFPDTAESFNNLGGELMRKKRPDQALGVLLAGYNLIVNKEEENVNFNLATCYRQCGFFSKAMHHLNIAYNSTHDQVKKDYYQKAKDEIHNKMLIMNKNQKELRKMGIL